MNMTVGSTLVVSIGDTPTPVIIKTISRNGYDIVNLRCVVQIPPPADLHVLSNKIEAGEVLILPETPNTLVQFTHSDMRIHSAQCTHVTRKALKIQNRDLGSAWIPQNVIQWLPTSKEYRVEPDYLINWY